MKKYKIIIYIAVFVLIVACTIKSEITTNALPMEYEISGDTLIIKSNYKYIKMEGVKWIQTSKKRILM